MEEKKKVRKIGRLTFGITLVFLGILIILATFLPIDVLRFGLVLGPIIFISLGVEIIVYSRKDDVNIKYDVLGIILTFFMIVMAGIFSIGNYCINKVLYSDEVKNGLSESLKNDNYMYYFKDGVVAINNASELPINLKIVENEFYVENEISVTMDFGDDINIISGLIGNKYKVYNCCLADYENNVLVINKNGGAKSINVTVFTNSRENLKLGGNFISE